MESKSYRYSRYNLVLRLLNLSLLLYIALRPFLAEHAIFWIYLKKAMVVITIYLIGDSIIRYAIPLIRKKRAIELNNNGLFYGVKNKRISWLEIRTVKPSPWGTRLRLGLNNQKKIVIDLSVIEGDDAEIYQNIVTYLEKSKTE